MQSKKCSRSKVRDSHYSVDIALTLCQSLSIIWNGHLTCDMICDIHRSSGLYSDIFCCELKSTSWMHVWFLGVLVNVGELRI